MLAIRARKHIEMAISSRHSECKREELCEE